MRFICTFMLKANKNESIFWLKTARFLLKNFFLPLLILFFRITFSTQLNALLESNSCTVFNHIGPTITQQVCHRMYWTLVMLDNKWGPTCWLIQFVLQITATQSDCLSKISGKFLMISRSYWFCVVDRMGILKIDHRVFVFVNFHSSNSKISLPAF